jgi:hydrogenase nickel incorporation protein HypA/HybF
MHEWALADAVAVALLDSLAGRDPDSLVRAELRMGELQAVDLEIFRFALQTILEPHGIKADKITLDVEKAGFVCRRCGHGWSLEEDTGLSGGQKESIHFLPEAAHAFLRCPSCGGADFSVEKGRGVTISRIVVEEKGAPEK